MEKTFIESRKEIETILHEEKYGFLGLSSGWNPYIVPVNYCYYEGKIIFQCALEGKKLDYIRNNPRVCFSVGRQKGDLIRHPYGASCHTEYDSAVCCGSARILENPEEKRKALTIFNRSFQPDADEIPMEAVKGCCVVEIGIEEMTDKNRKVTDNTCWKYTFEKQTD